MLQEWFFALEPDDLGSMISRTIDAMREDVQWLRQVAIIQIDLSHKISIRVPLSILCAALDRRVVLMVLWLLSY